MSDMQAVFRLLCTQMPSSGPMRHGHPDPGEVDLSGGIASGLHILHGLNLVCTISFGEFKTTHLFNLKIYPLNSIQLPLKEAHLLTRHLWSLTVMKAETDRIFLNSVSYICPSSPWPVPSAVVNASSSFQTPVLARTASLSSLLEYHVLFKPCLASDIFQTCLTVPSPTTSAFLQALHI